MAAVPDYLLEIHFSYLWSGGGGFSLKIDKNRGFMNERHTGKKNQFHTQN